MLSLIEEFYIKTSEQPLKVFAYLLTLCIDDLILCKKRKNNDMKWTLDLLY